MLHVNPAAISPVIGLSPPRSFAEASAEVEAALSELREAEAALERQLSDLQGYMRNHGVPAPGQSAPASIQ